MARARLFHYTPNIAHQGSSTVPRALSFVGLLVVGLAMLLSGLFFESAYGAGIAPWLHTTAGLAAASVGLIGLARMAARLPWRRVLRAARTPAALKGLAAAAVLAFAAHRLWERFRPLPAVPGASREAVAFYDDALWHMERFYLRKSGVDWPSFRRQAYLRIEGARTPRETFGAIRATLASLGKDAHNELMEENWRAEVSPLAPPSDQHPKFRLPPISARLTKDGVAYIFVPWFISDSGWGSFYRLRDREGRAYARRLREKLRSLDAMNPRGWIIDLRMNQGGSMWPMLDGLAPLIGEGRVAALDMPQFHRRAYTWIISGNSYSGVPWFAGLGPRPPPLKNGEAPVAILTGPATASAGEGLLVAFKGRPHTRQFGRPTFGASTAPDGYALGEGVVLYLTVARQMDRLGRSYDGPIPPDEEVAGSGRGDASPVVAAATRWIRSEAAAGSRARNF